MVERVGRIVRPISLSLQRRGLYACLASVVPATTLVLLNRNSGRDALALLPFAIVVFVVWAVAIFAVEGLIGSGGLRNGVQIAVALALSLIVWAYCSFSARIGTDGLGLIDLFGAPTILGMAALVLWGRSERSRHS